MTEPGAGATPATPSAQTPEDDLDSWREDIALITSSRPSQWLSLPIVYVGAGVLAMVALLLLAHGRALNFQGWVLIAAAGVLILWGFAFALMGRRAYLLHDLRESQRYVKVKVAGSCGLCILATAAGVISGSFGVAIIGFVIIWMMRSQRQVPPTSSNPSEFRVAISDIVFRAFLVEGIVLAATSLVCGLVALLVTNNASRIASEYIGGGAVLLLVGGLTTVMAIQQLPRRRNGS